MRRPLPIAIIALLAFAVLAGLGRSARADDVKLAWKLDKGTVLRYAHSSTQTAEMRSASAPTSSAAAISKQVYRIEYRLSALETDPGTGAARVLCRYDQVAIELQQAHLGTVKWDSRRREDLAAGDEPAVRPFARLVGQEFSFLLAPDGSVREVRGLDAVRKTILAGLEDSTFATAIGGLLSDGSVQNELEHGFRVLPDTPTATGGSWSRRSEEPLPLLGTLRYDTTETLEKVDLGRATIGFTSTLSVTAPPPPSADPNAAAVAVTLTAGTGSGKAIFAATAGRLERSDSTFEMWLVSRLVPPIASLDGPGSAAFTSHVKMDVEIELIKE